MATTTGVSELVHGAVHEGDHVWHHVERGLQRIANQELFGRFPRNSLNYDGLTSSTIGLLCTCKLLLLFEAHGS